jgi:hypothetical protein
MLEKIHNQIDALLRMTVSNGCTEAEAMLAAEKVSQLVLKYNIDLSSIDIEKTDIGYTRDQFAEAHPGSWKWQVRILTAVGYLLFCQVLITKPERNFSGYFLIIGTSTNRVSAIMLNRFIVRQMLYLGSEAVEIIRKSGRPVKGFLPAYYTAMSVRVSSRIAQEVYNQQQSRNSSKSLVLLDTKLSQYMQDTYGNDLEECKLKHTSSHNIDGWEQGYKDGGEINITQDRALG